MRGDVGGCCPVCGHALRLVFTGGRLVWVCPLCGEVRR